MDIDIGMDLAEGGVSTGKVSFTGVSQSSFSIDHHFCPGPAFDSVRGFSAELFVP